MINSMTGYGHAEGQLNSMTYAVEIKSVNNRYLKTRIKLPDAVAFLEEDIENVLRRNLSRGTINYTLELRNVSADVLFDIDEAALKAYMAKLGQIAESAGVECHVDMAGLLGLPGIMVPIVPSGETAGQVREAVVRVTEQAVEELKRMRGAEGAALAADMDGCCKAMKDDLDQIRVRKEVVLGEYGKKLKDRVDTLLAEGRLGLDDETLAREVAILADRSDISEEIARLDSHLCQFTESFRTDGQAQAGRKLDFISQEMLREANTIASKAGDAEIGRLVVDMKCQIDRLKEQVQNVE